MQEMNRDELTGLFNRGHFMAQLERATVGYTNASLLMIDVDHFTFVNEICGPAVGNLVLSTVAATISRISRSDDMVARIGGEEFAILVEGSDPEPCSVFAERLRHEIQTIRWPDHVRLPHGPLTVSVGCVTAAGLGIAPVRLLHQADGALFQSKREGRNRVTMAESALSCRRVGHSAA